MNEKKQRIIEESMRLFAKKGFHATSIQEIVDQCGISKGAFYLHFSSKKELTFAIYTYYYETIKKGLLQVRKFSNLNPTERFAKEIEVFFHEFMKTKEFIIMHMFENYPFNNDVEEFVFRVRNESNLWYENNLLMIYGEEIRPFIVDSTVMVDGLISSYIKVMLLDGVELNLENLSNFIVRRIDDVIMGMLENENNPQLTKVMLKPFFQTPFKGGYKEKISRILKEMKEDLAGLALEVNRLEDLLETIDVLQQEINKEEPQKIIFQGMLSNLREIEVLEYGRKKIASLMGIELHM